MPCGRTKHYSAFICDDIGMFHIIINNKSLKRVTKIACFNDASLIFKSGFHEIIHDNHTSLKSEWIRNNMYDVTRLIGLTNDVLDKYIDVHFDELNNIKNYVAGIDKMAVKFIIEFRELIFNNLQTYIKDTTHYSYDQDSPLKIFEKYAYSFNVVLIETTKFLGFEKNKIIFNVKFEKTYAST